MKPTIEIRPVNPSDLKDITNLYNHFISNTVITFEKEHITAADMQQRIGNVLSSYPFLVATVNSQFAGYAYATRWKKRAAYDATVESTIYLHPKFVKIGVGFKLYSELLKQLSDTDMHVAIGGIAQPNEASVALHLKCGFTYMGNFVEVGYKHGRWVDVTYYQKRLN